MAQLEVGELPRLLLVANAVTRSPSTSVMRSCHASWEICSVAARICLSCLAVMEKRTN